MSEFKQRRREFWRDYWQARRKSWLERLVYLLFALAILVLFAAGVWGIVRAVGWV